MTIIIIIATPREGSMGPAAKTVLQASKLDFPIRSLLGASIRLGFGAMCFSG